jgi:hypothetical protein
VQPIGRVDAHRLRPVERIDQAKLSRRRGAEVAGRRDFVPEMSRLAATSPRSPVRSPRAASPAANNSTHWRHAIGSPLSWKCASLSPLVA